MRDLKVETYTDEAGELRWRTIDPSNGLVVGASSEGFSSEEDLRHNIALNYSEDFRRVLVTDQVGMVVDLSNGMTITPDTA